MVLVKTGHGYLFSAFQEKMVLVFDLTVLVVVSSRLL